MAFSRKLAIHNNNLKTNGAATTAPFLCNGAPVKIPIRKDEMLNREPIVSAKRPVIENNIRIEIKILTNFQQSGKVYLGYENFVTRFVVWLQMRFQKEDLHVMQRKHGHSSRKRVKNPDGKAFCNKYNMFF